MSKLTPNARRNLLVVFLRIEGIAILGLGSFLILKGLFTKGLIEWFVISGILILALAGGIGLLIAAKGFKAHKKYGRAPAVLANLIAIGVSKYMVEANLWWVAIPITLIAVSIIILTLMETSDSKNSL
jgi:hypothetical protein